VTTEALEEELAQGVSGPLLSDVQVVDLFGRYTYRIPVPLNADGAPSRLVLLYGDNGSGKTTILTLLWNLLSPSPRRGHRSVLAKIPFRSLSVTFADGTQIVAEKISGLLGSYNVRVSRPGRTDVVVAFEAGEDLVIRPSSVFKAELAMYESLGETGALYSSISADLQQSIANQEAEERYLLYLQESGINPLFLADDRSLYTDDEETERVRERVGVRRSKEAIRPEITSANEAVERELQLTIGRVNEWLRTLTLRGQSIGSAGGNTIYADVLRGLAAAPQGQAPDLRPGAAGVSSAHELLLQLERDSPRFEEFELIPHFASSEFRALLDSVPGGRQQIAQDILIPYLTSLQARIEALGEAERMLRALLTLLNDFLVDKRLTFSPRFGLRIVTDDGSSLPPASLSSGERQLTMLLCTTLLARRDSRLFIIDEPELSLGIPWQRAIMGALLELTSGTSLQFIVATHSVEMISSQRQHLVRLERQVDGPLEG
jgi:energy-coupling factor transporter ATP-binding protein EcfA2